MSYKDKDKQKQAVRDAVKRHRESKGITYKQRQGITKGITDEGITQGITPDVAPADEGMLKPGQTAYDLGKPEQHKEYTNALGLTVKVLPDGLRQVFDPDGTLARIEEANGRPVSYNRPLMDRP